MDERTHALALRVVLAAQAVLNVVGMVRLHGFLEDHAGQFRFNVWLYVPQALFLVAALALAARPRRLPVMVYEALYLPGLAFAFVHGNRPVVSLAVIVAAWVVLLLPGAERPTEPAAEP